ncbi:MAG: class I SAM-dependent methyltransferase [Actinomycetota bacterium]|nr:class I SAM-dependent methyltransferase [Actinomycetota bacterium]
MTIHQTAQSFDAAACDYERARPDYPHEAGRWLSERLSLRPGRTVLDLAAGTGKLTRLLAPTGARVVAVEPVAGMRTQLAKALAGLELLEGTAESIPLPCASVDAVTVAQAFHWFDGERALSEIHRVSRASGRLAVLYNRRLLEDPLQAALEEILAPHRGATPAQRTNRWRQAFSRTSLWALVEEATLPHVQHLEREGVVARVASTSFVAALPVERRALVLREVRALVAARPEPIELPYVCELFLWERVP